MTVRQAWSAAQRRAIRAIIAADGAVAGPWRADPPGAEPAVADPARPGPVRPDEATLLTGLRDLVPADGVAAVTLDVAHHRIIGTVGDPTDFAPPDDADAPLYRACWTGVAWPAQPEALPSAFDLVAPAEQRRTRLDAPWGSGMTEVFVMCAPLRVSRDIAVQIMVVRRAARFTDSELLMLTLLAPHLQRRYRHAALAGTGLPAGIDPGGALAEAAGDPPADAAGRALAEATMEVPGMPGAPGTAEPLVAPDAGEPPGTPALTRRQQTVLILAAHGYSSNEIAHRLQLSPGTVQKHFDNIFDRLRVSNRLAAVTRAYPHGIPPQPEPLWDTPPVPR